MQRTQESDGEHWSIACPLGSADLEWITSGGTPSVLKIDGHLDRGTARIIRRNLEVPAMFIWSASPSAINELIRISSLKHLEVVFKLSDVEQAEVRLLMSKVSITCRDDDPLPP